MPPRGTKRAAEQVAPEQPAWKKCGVTKGVWNSFVDTVEHQHSGLTESCREMLLAMLPESVAVPSDERHSFQVSAVRMFEGVVEKVKAAIRASIEMTEKDLTALDARDSEVTGTLEGIEAVLTKAKDTTLGRRNALAEATHALLAKQEVLEEKQVELSEVQAQHKQSVEDKTLFDKAFVDGFQKLKAGDFEAHQTKQLYDTAMVVHKKLVLDESLKTALPTSLQKQPEERGPFENMVVLQLEQCFQTKIQELAKVVQEGAAPEAARRAAVDAARKELDATRGKQLKAADAFTEAQAVQEKAQRTVDDTQETLASITPERRNLVALKRKLNTQCENFVKRNEGNFAALRDRVTPPLGTEDANEEADAEQAEEKTVDPVEA